MSTYRLYWVITVLLVSAAVYLVSVGVLERFLEKFPDPLARSVAFFVLFVFALTHGIFGHRVALVASRNRDAADLLLKRSDALAEPRLPHDLAETAIAAALRRFVLMRQKKTPAFIGDLVHDDFDEELTLDLDRIKKVWEALFLFGIAATILGLILTLVAQGNPENAEQAKIYSATIVRGIGVAYTASFSCVSSGILLALFYGIFDEAVGNVRGKLRALAYAIFLEEKPPEAKEARHVAAHAVA